MWDEMNRTKVVLWTAILAFPCLFSGCPSTPPGKAAAQIKNEPVAPASPQPNADSPAPVTGEVIPHQLAREAHPHLHNLLKITNRLYSGGEPHGEAAFQALQELGVKTVVSVDGAVPQVELAEKHGMRYVHIPIGYDGVPTVAQLALARVMQDAKGPIYFHCHHGNHRGPAAAAIACEAAGIADPAAAKRILEAAGTSPDYAGLWRDVEKYSPPASDVMLPELVSVAKIEDLAAAMAKIDRANDNLKLAQAANWQRVADHPDISAKQEALLLREGLRESLRLLADMQDERFKEWMMQAEQAAAEFETQLTTGDAALAKTAFAAMQSQCKRCHVEYRDK